MYTVSEDECLKVANVSLKPNKAAGYDEFKPSIIKHVLPYILKPLTHIVNLSFKTGVFPNKLKTAKVLPVFKKGDPQTFENYRPISLLSCFAKIIERLMFNRVHDFLEAFHILCKGQYGFRPKHSTELALADALDKLCTSLDDNNISMGVFLDLSKAFDTIDHSILLAKLETYGIRGNVLEWFNSYISNRSQYTYYKGMKSSLKDICCGVPQGSILGPLLFIIYMNDIYFVSDKADIILFADDTNIFFKHKSADLLYDTASIELSKICNWFSANRLSLNKSKTT